MPIEGHVQHPNIFPFGPREDIGVVKYKIAQQAENSPVVVQLHTGREFTVPMGSSADEVQEQYKAYYTNHEGERLG